MPRIDLNNSDYALEVLSYYIWGEKNKPANIADEKYANKNEEIVLEFSTKDYLELLNSLIKTIQKQQDLSEHILEAKFMLLKGHFIANQNGICVK